MTKRRRSHSPGSIPVARMRPVSQTASAAWLGGAAQLAVGAAMLLWTWGTWPDVLVDSGRELYVPWRLASGELLFRDIAYFNGPLSPCLNAACFWLFGASVRTLVVTNLVLLILLVFLLNRLLAAVGGRLAATAAGIVFLCMFAFAKYSTASGYNYMFPYSHELTHGMLLSAAALYLLHRYQLRPRLGLIALVGLLVGLVLLTKAEVFVATVLAVVVGLVLIFWKSGFRASRTFVATAVFVLAALIPTIVSILSLTCGLTASEALWGTLGSWRWVFDRKLTSLQFYRWVFGSDDMAGSLRAILISAGGLGVLFCIVAAAAFVLGRWNRYRVAGAGCLAVLCAAAIYVLRQHIAWLDVFRSLPLVLAAASVVLAIRIARLQRGHVDGQAAILRLTLTLFSFVLLGKMLLNVHIVHYGFALAMPGTLLLVVMLVSWLPAWIDRRGGAGIAFRTAALVIIGVTVLIHVQFIGLFMRESTVYVGQGADRFRSGWRGGLVNASLDTIGTHVGPRQTLAALPEGVMLNYLSRRVNPTPFINFMPAEMVMFGEDRILKAFQQNPPDFIALVHKDTAEYGYRFFGTDYAQKTMSWIRDNYHPVDQVGDTPLRDEHYGVLLMQRNGG